MRIMFGTQDKAHCLHVPVRLLCSRLGVKLLTSAISSQTEGEAPTALLTRPQAALVVKALRQSGDLLKQSQLPFVDFQSKDGFFLRIEC